MITNIIRIGNSFGVILGKKLLQEAGVESSKEVSIEVRNGAIVITPIKKVVPVNLDRSTWGNQFKKAIKANKKPEKSVWSDEVSKKADNDWTW